VELVEALGSEMLVHFHLDAARIHAEPAESEEGAGDSSDVGELGHAARSEAVARLDPQTVAKPGGRIAFGVDTGRIHFFDATTGSAIWQ
jgi:multiple sugar transport system ATP-binding protein